MMQTPEHVSCLICPTICNLPLFLLPPFPPLFSTSSLSALSSKYHTPQSSGAAESKTEREWASGGARGRSAEWPQSVWHFCCVRLPQLPPLPPLLLLLHILQKFPTQFALPHRPLFLSSSLLVCIFCLLLLFLQCLSYLIFGRCLPRILLHWRRRRRRRLRFASISFFMCCFFCWSFFLLFSYFVFFSQQDPLLAPVETGFMSRCLRFLCNFSTC